MNQDGDGLFIYGRFCFYALILCLLTSNRALSVVFFPFFYPIKKLGVIRIIFAHYLINAIIMIGASIWCYFKEPGYIPGFCYSLAGLLYFIAFIRGEKTVTVEDLRSGRV